MKARISNIHWQWLSLAVILLDQITKQLVVIHMDVYDSIYLLPILNLTYLRNTGAAFSMLSDAPPIFFISLGIAVSIGVLWWLRKHPFDQKLVAIALVLVQGGAIGNVIDRAMPSRGYVIDFIDFHVGACTYCHWPAFNVADSAIVIGAVLLVYDAFRQARAERSAASS